MLFLAAAFLSCGKQNVFDYDYLEGRWYFHYYPFYQECDRTSYVDLMDNGYCETMMVCTDPPDEIVPGVWSHDGDILYLDCALLEGLNKDAKIKYLSADTLKLEAYYGSVRLPVNVTFAHNPK